MKKRRIIIISILIFLVLSISTFVIATIARKPASVNLVDSKFSKAVGYYESDQLEIASTNKESVNYTYMSDLYTIEGHLPQETALASSISNSTSIAIVSAEDLYAFSYLANPNTNASGFAKFLTFKYELLTNIDYQNYFINENGNAYFVPIGWDTESSPNGFTGSFNGNGYEIKGLRFVMITLSQQVENYTDMQYFAMFAKNSGTIEDFGLIEARIAISQTVTNMSAYGGVAAICGHNAGTISHVFAKDLRELSSAGSAVYDKEAGITAMGGYNISGFAVKNTGTISNCYVAYTIVSNYSVVDYNFFTEFLVENSGTLTNCFFYNASITDYEKQDASDIGSGAHISYTSNIGITYNLGIHYGFRAESISALNEMLANTNEGWITSSAYGSLISGYISINTAIRRQIHLKDGTDNVLLINNLSDYLYMYLLFNSNPDLASSKVSYEITSDINLENIPSILYQYDGYIASTIYGAEIDDGTSTLIDGTTSKYPTIYNASIFNYVTVEGVDAYGIFPYLTGTIKNLNFASTDTIVFNEEATSNVKAIGLIAGYTDGGTIENVNTYADISFYDNIGKYFAGGIVGLMAGGAHITNVTTSGPNKAFTNISATSSTIENPSDFIAGNCMGGIVGYISDTYGNLSKCKNTYNMTCGLGNTSTNAPYAIGGVIGAGYTQ
nr:hypothetical protein [Bacilli bacterium]